MALRLVALGAAPTWAPTGKRLGVAISGYDEPSGAALQSDLYALPAGGARRMFLLAGTTDDREPAWAPDGSKIVFARFDRQAAQTTLRVLDLRSRRVTRLTPPDLIETATTRAENPRGERVGAACRRPGSHTQLAAFRNLTRDLLVVFLRLVSGRHCPFRTSMSI